jgi:hypothetical protein
VLDIRLRGAAAFDTIARPCILCITGMRDQSDQTNGPGKLPGHAFLPHIEVSPPRRRSKPSVARFAWRHADRCVPISNLFLTTMVLLNMRVHE